MIQLFKDTLQNPAGAVSLYAYKIKDIMRYPKWGTDQNNLLGSFTPDRLLTAVQGYELKVIQETIRFNEVKGIDVQGPTYSPVLTCRIQGDDWDVHNDLNKLGSDRFILQWLERQAPKHPDFPNNEIYKMAGTPEQAMELTWRYVNEAAAGNAHIYELTFKAISNSPAAYTLLALVD